MVCRELGQAASPIGGDSESVTIDAINMDLNVWVRVSDDNGSTDSETARVSVPDVAAPAAIDDLRAQGQGNGVTLSWTAPGTMARSELQQVTICATARPRS